MESSDQVMSDVQGSRAAVLSLLPSNMSFPPGALFPARLYQLLEDAEKEGNEDAISWLPDGMGFKVHDKVKFETALMPRYFGSSKYRSFQKNLNLWEFKTVLVPTNSPRRGECSHPLFVRNKPELCNNMKRVVKSKCQKKAPAARSETGMNTSGIIRSFPAPSPAAGAAPPAPVASPILPLPSPAPAVADEALRLLQLVLNRTESQAPAPAGSQNHANLSAPAPMDGQNDSPLVRHIRAAERARNRGVEPKKPTAGPKPPTAGVAAVLPNTANSSGIASTTDDQFGALVSSLLSRTNLVESTRNNLFRDHQSHLPTKEPVPLSSLLRGAPASPPTPPAAPAVVGGVSLGALVSSLGTRTNLGALGDQYSLLRPPSPSQLDSRLSRRRSSASSSLLDAGAGPSRRASASSSLLDAARACRRSSTSSLAQQPDVGGTLSSSSISRTAINEVSDEEEAHGGGSGGEAADKDEVSRFSKILKDATASAAILLLQEQRKRREEDLAASVGYPRLSSASTLPGEHQILALTAAIPAAVGFNEDQLKHVLSLGQLLGHAPPPLGELQQAPAPLLPRSSSVSLLQAIPTPTATPTSLEDALTSSSKDATLRRVQAAQLLVQAQAYNDELSRILGLLDQLSSETK